MNYEDRRDGRCRQEPSVPPDCLTPSETVMDLISEFITDGDPQTVPFQERYKRYTELVFILGYKCKARYARLIDVRTQNFTIRYRYRSRRTAIGTSRYYDCELRYDGHRKSTYISGQVYADIRYLQLFLQIDTTYPVWGYYPKRKVIPLSYRLLRDISDFLFAIDFRGCRFKRILKNQDKKRRSKRKKDFLNRARLMLPGLSDVNACIHLSLTLINELGYEKLCELRNNGDLDTIAKFRKATQPKRIL